MDGKQFQLYRGDGAWEELFLTGVNIGATKPGTYPGEVAVTSDDYFRWFRQIGELNANVIRVYIPQSPAFYQALYEYNRSSSRPLYLLQGVYVDENEVQNYQDAYAGDLRALFEQDIRDAADMIHGNADIPQQTGRAWGRYRYDVSEYVVGWILGIEWDAGLVLETNRNNPDRSSFDGTYIRTENASPFEVFLAETAETAVAYETERYGMQRPVALSNWPTTDPLSHPNEPLPEVEDAVSVDTDHILPTDTFLPGLFASYHVYPYYPDFMIYDTKYLQGERPNPYRAYLEELNAYVKTPLLVAEFGVPTSRGITHLNPVTGFDHGGFDERGQGDALVSMLSDIRSAGCMGGIVFSWQDEWFKTTWNTADLDLADHRASWHDVQTSEQNYGLLSFDPGEAGKGVVLDGDAGEWRPWDRVLEQDGLSLSARSDEAYLYLLLTVDDFENGTYYVPIDTIPGQGNTSYEGTSFAQGADFLLRLGGREGSALLVDPYYDPNYKLYEYSPNVTFSGGELALYRQKDSGRFGPVHQVVNRTMYLPETGQSVPFQTVDTGLLRYGSGDPAAPDYDNRADLCAGTDGTVEVRIPWLSLNVRDPSTRQIMDDLHTGDGIGSRTAEAFSFGLVRAGEGAAVSFAPYALPGWDEPSYHERLKDSYYVLQNALSTDHPPLTQSAGRGFFLSLSGLVLSKDVTLLLFCFFSSVLLYLTGALFVIQGKTTARANRQVRCAYWLDRALALSPEPAARSLLDIRYFCSPRGLETLHAELRSCSAAQNAWLREQLEPTALMGYLRRSMHSRDRARRNLAVKVAGELRLPGFEAEITALLLRFRQEPDLQYNGFLALALTGCQAALLRLCLDPAYTTRLSFRCLHEIFAAYAGDKGALYARLLDAPDPYVRRSCVKCIGDEGLCAFTPRLLPLLESDNTELLLESIRTLGKLGCTEAGEQIARYASDPRWSVRGAALSALAAIDLDSYLPVIAAGLHDPEWWVRYHAAMRLTDSQSLYRVLAQVRESGDRFAVEILCYAMERRGLERYAAYGEEVCAGASCP